MSKNIHKKSKYKAQGFVEALIAILVAGVACVSLMMIASKTISQMNQNELRDQLTTYAVQGSEMMKFLVDGYVVREPIAGSGIDQFLPLEFSANGNLLDAGKCVAISGELTNASLTSKANPVCTYNQLAGGIVPGDCIDGPTSPVIVNPDEQGDIFRIMCVHPESTPGTLVVKFFTGFTKCKDLNQYISVQTNNHSDCVIYEYTSVYSTVQIAENQ